MKRFIPYALVALLVLVPAGFVLAAKSGKTKKSAETKAAHRSAKQKAANEKLVQELLTIMEETDNKMTFAACAECLTQLKPPREVVVPALIRKADKMGWLKADANGNNNDEMAMMGEIMLSFLPHKKGQPQAAICSTLPMPAPACFAPPMPSSPYAATVYPCPQPMPYPTVPASYSQPTYCPPPLPCPMPPTAWEPATRQASWPVVPAVLHTPATATDKMTSELLKILEETESKVTYEVVADTLAARDQNWEVVIPALIRKADKMGWLKSSDKDFTDSVAELAATKAKQTDKVAPPSVPSGCRIIFNGNGVSFDEPNEGGLALVPFVDSGVVVGTPVCQGIRSAEQVPMPRSMEVITMPRATEMAPMPHRKAMPRPQE